MEGLFRLATAEQGTGYIVKLAIKYNEKMTVEHLESEVKIWKDIWGISQSAESGWSSSLLAMPHLRMCKEGDTILQDAARETIILMARKGFKHKDLSLQHVGFMENMMGYMPL